MKTRYVYLDHSGFDIYFTEEELTSEELYCAHCDDSDVLLGKYDTEEEFAIAMEKYLGMYGLMPNKAYFDILRKYAGRNIIFHKSIFDYDEEPFYIDNGSEGYVGLFFYVKDHFILKLTDVSKASEYGDFMVLDESHNEVWNKEYASSYGADFDYYPRGRITYRRSDKKFLIYYDECIAEKVKKLSVYACNGNYEFVTDEHYVCHTCNKNYLF